MATYNFDPNHFYTLNNGEIFDAKQARRMVVKRLPSWMPLEVRQKVAALVTDRDSGMNGCTITALVNSAINKSFDLES